MVGGAPRTVSGTKEEVIALGKEMVEWVKINKPVHLSDWYTLEKMIIYKDWKNLIAKEEFFPYYEMALKLVGRQYLVKDSPIEPSLKHRWQRVYFKDLKDEENEEAEHKASLNKSSEMDQNDFRKQLLDVVSAGKAVS